jgi:rhodanese-related sulfurtransferase
MPSVSRMGVAIGMSVWAALFGAAHAASQATTAPKMAPPAQSTLNARIETLYHAIEADILDVPTVAASAVLVAATSANPPIFVDVRAAAERSVSALPSTVSLAELPALHRAHPARAVVVYCTIGYRSGLAARTLIAQGIPARNLRGGILAWIAAGGALLDTQRKPTQKVHVYAKAWAVVPDNFTAIY